MPALLLARPVKDADDIEASKPFSDIKLVKTRLALAETGQHAYLLLQYLKDVDKRRDMQSLPLRRDPELFDKFAKVVRAVERDDVERALGTLLGDSAPQQTEDVAQQVDELAAVRAPAEEYEMVEAEVRMGLELWKKAAIPKEKDVKRTLWAINDRRKAAPGPSGWRNSCIACLGREQEGKTALREWSELWAKGRIHPKVVELWGAQIIAPIIAARATEPPQDPWTQCRDKLRPIALEEALVKFAEGAQIGSCIDRILQILEPHHLGTGTPDGPLLCVDVLRMWAKQAAWRALSPVSYPSSWPM